MVRGGIKRRHLPQRFKKGQRPPPRKVAKQHTTEPSVDDQQQSTSSRYMRLQSFADDCLGPPQIFDTDGKSIEVKLLRPRKEPSPEGSGAVSPDAERNTNRIFHLGQTEKLWNEAITGHREHAEDCSGKLEWDITAEKQFGLAWEERIMCQDCKYVSPAVKLYIEVDENKRGRKPAAINRALQVGLSHNMIGNSAMRDLLLALNIPAPASSGMQKQANKVSVKLEEVNREDMSAEVDRLADMCRVKVGSGTQSLLAVEGDCRYNNRLSSGVGKTPYQPATQAVYTICENVTPQKKVVAVVVKNKLCSTAEYLESKGQTVTCPNHEGHCSADIQPTDSIGNEAAWASEGFRQILDGRDDVAVKYFTTDGDSAAYQGLETVQAEKATGILPVNLRDTRHLSESLRNAIKNARFSIHCFPGNTMKDKEKEHKWLATEMSRRCTAEYTACFEKFDGNIAKVKAALSPVPGILVSCYSGDHSQCDKSFTCKDWDRTYIPDMKINPSQKDRETLMQCMLIRLGEEGLEKTKLNTTTQKSEAFNRALSRTLPKCQTFKRNVRGRAHSIAHLVNRGIAQSTADKCQAVGAPLTAGSRVVKQLKEIEKRIIYRRMKMKSKRYRQQRNEKRKKRYLSYFQKQEDVKYSKGLLELDTSQGRKDHSYSAQGPGFVKPSTSGYDEHAYTCPPADAEASTSGVRRGKRLRKVRLPQN